MGKRVLDIEVLGIVEDSNNLARAGGGSRIRSGITALGRDGNGVERDGGLCDFGHDERRVEDEADVGEMRRLCVCVRDKELVEEEVVVVCCCESFCQTEGTTRNAALLSCRKRKCDGACRLYFSLANAATSIGRHCYHE